MKRTTVALAALLLLAPVPRAFAVNREMVQLQTQVQQLQDTLERMQQSNDERMGVLRQLVQQTADTVSKMAVSVDAVQKQMQSQSEGQSSAQQQLSGQIQSLNDSVDELKSRMAKLQTALTAIQNQQQSLSSQPAATGATDLTMASSQPGAPSSGRTPPQAAAQTAPPLDQLYQAGIRDYNAAKYDLAAQEFSDVLRYYPQDDRAGNAQFYLAEIAYRQGDYQNAVKGYDAVLEQYPGNVKAPTAQLRKGQSLQALNQRDAAVREYRSLINRYPQSPEAIQARSKLNAMGVTIAPKPSGARVR
jgi:tol-pal system protein YbgF